MNFSITFNFIKDFKDTIFLENLNLKNTLCKNHPLESSYPAMDDNFYVTPNQFICCPFSGSNKKGVTPNYVFVRT